MLSQKSSCVILCPCDTSYVIYNVVFYDIYYEIKYTVYCTTANMQDGIDKMDKSNSSFTLSSYLINSNIVLISHGGHNKL